MRDPRLVATLDAFWHAHCRAGRRRHGRARRARMASWRLGHEPLAVAPRPASRSWPRATPLSAQMLDAPPAASFRFDPRPTLRIGDVLTIAVTARVQADVRAPDATSDDDVDFDIARRRIGLTGTVTRHVRVRGGARARRGRVARRVRERPHVAPGAGARRTVQDAVQPRSAHERRASLDFVSRSRAADLLAPGRSTGVSLHGRVAGQIARLRRRRLHARRRRGAISATTRAPA